MNRMGLYSFVGSREFFEEQDERFDNRSYAGSTNAYQSRTGEEDDLVAGEGIGGGSCSMW